MRQLNVRISQNEKLAQDFYKMKLRSPYLAKKIKPGQFVHIRPSTASNPLLRRPFSVHRISKNGIEILYEVVGKGTEILSQKKRGEYLDVIGPLGNGFDLRPTNDACPPAVGLPRGRRERRTTILIAGGIGVAPLVALAEKIAHSSLLIGHRKKKKKIYVIIGAKTKSKILCERGFKSLGCDVKIATEDGSKGQEGLATDLLKHFLSAMTYDLSATIYACGPDAMLGQVSRIAKSKRIPCQVSLEEYMACGVGVCLGCPVKVKTPYAVRSTQHEYKMVCKDGPIFDAEEIVW